MQHCQVSTTNRTASGLDFTAKGGKRQGCEAPGLENPNNKTYAVDFMSFDI
jgi:hypothetical protein